LSIVHISDRRENATLSDDLALTNSAGEEILNSAGENILTELNGTWSVIIEHVPFPQSLFHVVSEERFETAVHLDDWVLTNSAGEEILNSAGENILTELNDTWSVPLRHI